jgi:anti-anti-sigma regulatory factor
VEVHIIKRDGTPPVAVLKPNTEINMSTYGGIDTAARAEHANGLRYLIIDMSNVPYMTSAGIRLLNSLFKLYRAGDPTEDDAALSKGFREGNFTSTHLKLVNPNDSVREVLKTSGLDMVLTTYANVDEAINSL